MDGQFSLGIHRCGVCASGGDSVAIWRESEDEPAVSAEIVTGLKDHWEGVWVRICKQDPHSG